MLAAAVVFMPAVVQADSIAVNDYLVIKDAAPDTNAQYNPGTGTLGGGTWWVDEVTYPGGAGNAGANAGDFKTFCVELNETIYVDNSTIFKVNSIEKYAVKGGVGGASGNKDYLSIETQALYHYFRFGGSALATGAQFQRAFWFYENEAPIDSVLNPAYVWANANAATYLAAISNGLHTRALNLTTIGGVDSQTLLTVVPDGGATLALLGCALMGLGALRRKFRQ